MKTATANVAPVDTTSAAAADAATDLATTNATADGAPAADAPAADAKAPSKMDICKELYDEVFAQGYDLGGKSQRAVFIARAIAEKGMSKNGANTYYQNISNLKRGKGLYKYNKYVGKAGSKSAEAKAAGATTEAKGGEAGLDLPGGTTVSKADVANAEALAGKVTNDLTKRWQVLDDDEVVNSFDTRNAAKKAAVGGLVMRDAQAK